MQKRLSRLKARVSIVLLALALAALVAGYFAEGWYTSIAAVVFVLASIASRFGKCPTCGKNVSPAPQWSQPGKYHCPYCGSRFAYDDESEEA